MSSELYVNDIPDDLWMCNFEELSIYWEKHPRQVKRHLQELCTALGLEAKTITPSEIDLVKLEELKKKHLADNLWFFNGDALILEATERPECVRRLICDILKAVGMEIINAAFDVEDKLIFPVDFKTFFNENSDPTEFFLDWMSTPSLLALSFTCKSIYERVTRHVYQRLKIRFHAFSLNPDDILKALQKSNAIIAGSFALMAAIPYNARFPVNNMDFFTPVSGLRTLIADIARENDYVITDTSNKTQISLMRRVNTVYTYTRRVNSRQVTLNFFVVDHTTKPITYEPLFYSSTTLTMNAITGHGIFVPYGRLLEDGIGIRNHVHRSSRIAAQSASIIQREEEFDNINQRKLEEKGFYFTIKTHKLHAQCGRCKVDPSCVKTIRSLDDRGCSFMRILKQGDQVALFDAHRQGRHPYFPVVYPVRPDTIWRLTGPKVMYDKDDKKGFVDTI